MRIYINVLQPLNAKSIDILSKFDENVKINISKENFSIVENIDLGGELIIRHKNVSGQMVFKKIR